MNTKQYLLESYNTAKAEFDQNHPIVTNLRGIISRHYPELRDIVTNPDIYSSTEVPSVGVRQPISLADYYQGKKKSPQPTESSVAAKIVENQTDLVETQSVKTEDIVPEETLIEWSKLSAEELLEQVGKDRLKDTAKVLGYKIHHKSSDIKFAEQFKEALLLSLNIK